jgi:hypothetical protein
MMSRTHARRGQSMTETIVIILLCAIGLLLVVTRYGNDLKRMFWTSSSSLRDGKNQKVVHTADYFDKNNHTTGTMALDSPYTFNEKTGTWVDPNNKYKMVSDAEAAKYIDNIEDYKEYRRTMR